MENMIVVMKMLKKIDSTISDEVMPRLTMIENRLSKFENHANIELSQIKASTSQLLLEVTESVQSVGSFSNRRTSDCSDSLSDSSDSSDRMSDQGCGEPSQSGPPKVDKYGLIMSDVDMSELAIQTGQLLDCEVSMFDYSSNTLDPSLFDRKLEFVILQDSGKLLDKYTDITTEVVKEVTDHVHNLLKVAMNILDHQPDTKVFLGSLPPRLDGRLKKELVKIFNSILITETMIDGMVEVINQDQLHCLNQKKVEERYKTDLVTLTGYGKTLRVKNTAMQIAKVVPGLSVVKKKHQHPTHPHHRQVFAGQGGSKYTKYKKQKVKALISEILHNF